MVIQRVGHLLANELKLNKLDDYMDHPVITTGSVLSNFSIEYIFLQVLTDLMGTFSKVRRNVKGNIDTCVCMVLFHIGFTTVVVRNDV